MNEDLTEFKLQIFKYTFIIALIFGVASLPLLGVSIKYFYGLALGTCVAVVNFNILVLTGKKVLEFKKKSLSMAGYLIRLLIYGFAFYMSMQVGNIAGVSCVLGFMTVKFAIFYIYGFKTKFSKGRTVRPEVQAEFERMDREKEAHKGDRLIDKIRREINYQEDEIDDTDQKEG